MTPKEILEAIAVEENYYHNTELVQNPAFAEKQWEVLDLVDRYMLSQYRDSDIDSLGQKKLFYNIVSLPVDIATKQLDIDTKDIQIIATDENYWSSWVMGKELNLWMKEQFFGTLLNKMAHRYARDGHLVCKKVGKEVQIVPIKALMFRPDTNNKIQNIPVVELHYYKKDEFEKVAKDRGWNTEGVTFNPNSTITSTAPSTPSSALDEDRDYPAYDIIVYEYYFPKGYQEDDDKNYNIITSDGILLAETSRTSSPYKDIPWEIIFGRTSGRGQVEKLFDEQIYLNRIANYKAEGLSWTSKHIFQTRDNAINTNLLFETENGDVMPVNSEIQPISTEERNLSFYGYEEGRWENNAYSRTFTTEPLAGQRSPAGTPLGSTILQAQMAGGYYKQKKEELANFIKEIIWDWVLPEFKNDNRAEHEVLLSNILDNDRMSEQFLKMQLDDRMNKLLKKGQYMSPEQLQIRKAINAEIIKNSKLNIPKGIYDNLKQKISILITGEEIDTASKLTTLQTVFQIIASNPTVFRDKRVRKVFDAMLNLSGINPQDLDFDEEVDIEAIVGQSREEVAQRGGSIAAPRPSPVPQQVTQLQTA